jgi:CHAT domain-containing protein
MDSEKRIRRLRAALFAASALAALGSGAAHAQQPPADAASTPPAAQTEWERAFAAIAEARQAGRLDEAERLARQAVAAAQAPGADQDALAFAHGQLGLILQGQRRFDEALAELKASLDITARLHGADSVDAQQLTVQLGNVELNRDRFEAADAFYRRAIEISGRRAGPAHPDTMRLMTEIASAYSRNGMEKAGLALMIRAREVAEREPGEKGEVLAQAIENLGGFQMALGDGVEAERLLKDALARRAAGVGRDHESSLRNANNLATMYLNGGKLAQAEPLAADTLPRAQRALGNDHQVTLDAVAVMGQLRAKQGRYAEAEPLLLRVLAEQERRGEDLNGMIATGNLLALAYADRGKYKEAEPLFRRTLDRAVKAFGAGHPLSLTTANGVAYTLLLQGRYDEAEPMLREVLAGLEQAGLSESSLGLQTLSNLATNYQLQARFAEAEPMLLRAVEVGERTMEADDPGLLLFLSNLAELFVKQGRIDEAVPLAMRAYQGAERRLGPDSPRTLLFANNAGAFLKLQGNNAEAEPLLRRVLAGRERTFGFDNRDTLLTASSVGTILFEQGKQAEAKALLTRVVAAGERALGALHPETISYRLMLAGMHQRSSDLAQAEALFARVLADGTGKIAPTSETMIQAAAGLSVTRQALALISGRSAGDTLTPARQMAAGLRARRADRGGRLGSAQAARELVSRGDYFLLLADALWDKQEPSREEASEAFQALQDSVAGTTDRAVLQMAVRRFADGMAGGLGALVREREELEGRWSLNSRRQVELLTDAGATPQERATLRAEAATIEQRLDAVDAQLRRDFPDYFDLVNPGAISMDSAASVLEADEVLLMIVPGFRGTHLIAVTDAGLTWKVSAWDRKTVDAAVRRLLWQLGGAVTPTAEEQAAWSREPQDAFDRATAHQLYTQIFAPMNQVLAGKRHVFIAASGSLSSLPFGVLVTDQPQGRDDDPAALRATKWLADAHALIQVPSVQSMLLLRRANQEQRGGDRFLGFGDPVLEGGAQARGGTARGATRGAAPARPLFSGRLTRSGTPMADVSALRSMARLPGTAEELRNMRTALAAPDNSIFLGSAATEAQFRSMDLSNVRILALATHGLVAGEIDGAGEPGLVFTPPAEPSEQDDGFLTASEISSLRLNADWVILSACNTASGDGSEGAPGLSGLARAFFYAGARTLLASHWPVRDDVGARLTVRTVALQREQPKLSRAEAFQLAMREIRGETAQDAGGATWAHPSAWAPFTLIGDAAR